MVNILNENYTAILAGYFPLFSVWQVADLLTLASRGVWGGKDEK